MINKALLPLFILLYLIPSLGYGAQLLRFSDAKGFKEQKIVNFIQKQRKSSIPLILAPIDLNHDAINEYILRPKDPQRCIKPPLCTYHVIALQKGTPLSLGTFDAHKIAISDQKTYGINGIIVYNDPHNDFKNVTAVWNPFNFRFELP